MTEQEQRIAIAEFCGWKHQEGEEIRYGGTTKTPGWFRPDGKFSKGRLGQKEAGLPDFCNHLNAMHEAENVMSDDQREQFAYELLALIGIDCDEPCTPLEIARAISATAAQRSEAFLKCIGKWKD